jgi:hypothetical protein
MGKLYAFALHIMIFYPAVSSINQSPITMVLIIVVGLATSLINSQCMVTKKNREKMGERFLMRSIAVLAMTLNHQFQYISNF